MSAAAIVESKFAGWEKPESNFFKVPNEFWQIEDLTVHERMVLLYILRHTWGFQEYGVMKNITIDEFQNGRKAGDERMDKGCGVSRGGISQALASLEAKGYIQVMTDVSDPARVKKHYMLNMQQDSVHGMNTAFTPRTQRSRGGNRTEKETIERNLEKEEKKTPIPPSDELLAMQEAVKKHLKQYGKSNEQVAKALLGLYAGKDVSLNLSKPFTPALLEKFAVWWDSNYRKDGKSLTRPKNLDSVKSYGETFLDSLAPATPKLIQAAPVTRRGVMDGVVTFNKPEKKEQAG